MRKLILVAITTITLLGINGLGFNSVQAQSLEQEVQGVKISKAYPNPAQGVVSFDYAISAGVEKVEVQFFNLIGEVVLREKLELGTSNAKISIAELKKGVYFYRLMVNGKNRGGIQKLIVQ